jgi:hypothetical protein
MAAHWAAAGGHPGAAVTILDAKDPGIPGIVGFVMFLPMYFLGNVLAAVTMWRSRYVPRLTGASGERIVAAVRAVAAGDAFFGSDVAAGLLGRLAGWRAWARDHSTAADRPKVRPDPGGPGKRAMATPTGLEPAASAVTGRRANQLRYGARLLLPAEPTGRTQANPYPSWLPNPGAPPTGFEPVLPP